MKCHVVITHSMPQYSKHNVCSILVVGFVIIIVILRFEFGSGVASHGKENIQYPSTAATTTTIIRYYDNKW